MSNFIVITICFTAGMMARRWGKFPPDSHRVLNSFLITISLPCLEFVPLRRAALDDHFLVLAAMPWFLFGTSFLLFSFLEKRLRWDFSTTACLCLSAGLGNTSFLGIPLIEVFYGRDSVPTAVVIDQLGTFLTLSIPGTYLGTKAALAANSGKSFTDLLKRILSFPPFWGMIIALLSRPFSFPPEFEQAISKIGDTLTPLALFSVGYQLIGMRKLNSDVPDAENFSGAVRAPLAWGLVYKLILGPLLVWLVFGGYYFMMGSDFGQNVGSVRLRDFKVLILEAGMAPMITGSLLAAEWGLNPRLSVSLVGIGIPLSFVTTLGLYYLLEKWAWIGTISFVP
ncbi:permease [Leptospira fletcheri]|uniref:Permease n=1 Tax=Leptospira fletcheri TaxID=2484981 RepID=A0A4R9GG62_9LEPT|nr:AEC family transporter [Leptospira fletcheri]TGK11529.1 permease [Leptospira fletcheri]